MRCRVPIALALAFAFAFVTTSRAAEDDGDPEALLVPTWYAQVLARGDGGLNVTHFWSRGPMLRTETVVGGHKIVTIVRDDWYYAYDAVSQRGVKIRRHPSAIANDDPKKRPFGNEYDSLIRQGAELVRQEVLLGRPAGVFRVTDDAGRREAWITLDDHHLPLRLEVYDRERANRRYTDYLNWQSGLLLPETYFQPGGKVTLEALEFEEYIARTNEQGYVGPVPVFYIRLLHVR